MGAKKCACSYVVDFMSIVESKNTNEKALEDIALRRMQKARADLLLSHPFFGSIALKLELKSDTKCPNLATDGKTLTYNPHFISVLSNEHIIASQAHEILHIACNHHIRRNGRDAKLWNKACDYAINSLLNEAGFSLPETFFKHDKAYDNMSVDDIYVQLLRLYDQDIHGGAQSAQVAEQTDKSEENGSSGTFDNEQEDKSTEDKKKDTKAENSDEDTAKSQEKNKAENEGDSNENSANKQSVQSSFFGEINDHPMLSEENNKSMQKALEESLIQITQAMQSSANQGDIPLGILRLYQQAINPQLNWQSLLQRFIENCNDGDFTWSTPNRRYISQDIYLPSRKEPRIPTMALAIDASGSVDDKLLALFCAELENILESYDTTLFIMYHDTKVQKHEIYTRADRPLKLFVQGGGGTSYKDIPNFIEKENIQPSCLLWFTDFECNLFPEEPHYPVLWVSTSKEKENLPFGDVIYLK